MIKYRETLPAEPSAAGAIAQFRADAKAAGIDRYQFQTRNGRTEVEVKAAAWLLARRPGPESKSKRSPLLMRRCGLRNVLGHSYTIKIQIGGKMFTVHSKPRNSGDTFSDWESAAEYARKLILNKGATDVWIEES